MIEVTTLQWARLPIIGLAALGLVAVGGASLARVNVGSATVEPTIAVQSASVPSTTAVPPGLSMDSGSCGQGAYITGDVAGDESPALVLARICGGR
jgi:hypothetical protein